jgi:hypothetical protein
MDIKRTPYESITTVRANVPLCPIYEGSKFFIFGALANAAVWVSSHGEFHNETFTVPPGISIQYFCRHGYTLEANIRRVPNMRQDPAGNPGLLIAPGALTNDYTLEKFQGRWGMLESYETIAERAVAANVTIVTIRNRWWSDKVKVSELIPLLRAQMPNLNLVNGFHCRATTPPLGSYP